MKRMIFACIALCISVAAGAQSLGVVSGRPITKKTADVVVGALVTLTDVWTKQAYQRMVVNDEGFEMVVPHGSYDMKIEASGYETYNLELDIDDSRIDLGSISMLTEQMAAEKAAKRQQRKAKRG